jgi:diamine N-acetyltransferase
VLNFVKLSDQKNMSHKIIKATLSDHKILSDLCYQIYPQTYSNWWFDGGKWYMETMYNPDKMLIELEDKNAEFYFLTLNEEPIGYLKVNHSFKNERNSFEIERIYLNQTYAGQGLGNKLLNFGIEIARSLNRKTVHLKVMASGNATIKFYEKNGFEAIGSELLPFELLKPELRIINTMRKIL